jgi:hypothetical protein
MIAESTSSLACISASKAATQKERRKQMTLCPLISGTPQPMCNGMHISDNHCAYSHASEMAVWPELLPLELINPRASELLLPGVDAR